MTHIDEKSRGRKHFIIGDCQTKDGVRLDHLEWAGKYAAEKTPDVIVCIGDFADMPSLSSYDKGKRAFEGRRYGKDIAAAHRGMKLLRTPIDTEMKKTGWKPKFILTLGNHEDRINRATNDDPKLEGLIGIGDLPYSGWTVYPYLQQVVVDGVAYCHYFTSGVLGRPVTSARALNSKKHMSCVMGHVQRKEIDIQYTGAGKRITSIFAGSYYQHKEDYLGPQGNQHWHGCWMLHQVKDGQFDEMPISLSYLKSRYSK